MWGLEKGSPVQNIQTVQTIEIDTTTFDFTGKIFDLLNSTFSVLSTNIFRAFSQEFALLMLPLMILYIVCVGFCGLQGWMKDPQKTIRTIGITYLVMSLMGSGDFLIDHVFWVFTELPLSIMGWVANSAHPQDIRGYTGGIDTLFTNIFSALKLLGMTIQFSVGNIWNSILNGISILLVFGYFGFIFFKLIMIVINNIARVHILIALSGPIIYLSIFEKTRGLFFGMLRGLTNCSFSLIFAGSIIAIMSGAVIGAAQGVTSVITQMPMKAVSTIATDTSAEVRVKRADLVSDITLIFNADFFMLLIIGVVLLSLISKSEELASMLTTAIASHSQGMASAAATGAVRAAQGVYSAGSAAAPYAAAAAKAAGSGLAVGSNRIASGIKGVWLTK